MTPPQPLYRVYDGSEKELVAAGTVPEGCTMLYRLEGDDEYSEKIPTATEPGEYTVWYKVEGSKNYRETAENYVTAYIVEEALGYLPPVGIGGLVYNGNEQQLITVGEITSGSGKFVYAVVREEDTSDIAFTEEWEEITGKDAGVYRVYYKVVAEDGSDIGELTSYLTVTVAKARPYAAIPYLTAECGTLLKDIALPEGFEWADKTQSVGDVGEHSFAAEYTPKDTKNFNVLSLMLTVQVMEKPAEETTKVTEPTVTTTSEPITTTQAATTTSTTTTTTVETAATPTAETTTSATTTAATETTTTASTPPAVTVVTGSTESGDRNQPTGAALAVVPFIGAIAGTVISRRRK